MEHQVWEERGRHQILRRTDRQEAEGSRSEHRIVLRVYHRLQENTEAQPIKRSNAVEGV